MSVISGVIEEHDKRYALWIVWDRESNEKVQENQAGYEKCHTILDKTVV